MINPVEDVRMKLALGSILLILSPLISIIGFFTGIIGFILYFMALSEWKKVDERPLKLAIFQVFLGFLWMIILIFVSPTIINRIHFVSESMFMFLYVHFLISYPVVALLLYLSAKISEYFFEVTGDYNFNLAKRLYLVAIPLYPAFLLGTVLGIFGRIAEIIGYLNMKKIVRRPGGYNIRLRDALGIVATVPLTILLVLMIAPNYIIEVEKGDVGVLVEEDNGVYNVIVYCRACYIDEVIFENESIYSKYRGSYVVINGIQYVKVSTPRIPRYVEVKVGPSYVHFDLH
ncbi:hypothetical protein PNA2_1453 [Pyrococcus sp. NA2]|uniref:hypothetical protein n=1 Tax=Pyrococcus sp. (strain NA2) TaxID=342949 RepID=UPI000209AF8C|nr:hypothetical protein [Pyrococcus sp. NA2]AEC52368.1 hypothetical protein PNA2_1453 [Pyrococcus sp. NA2]